MPSQPSHSPPTLSAVMPNYNHSRYLAHAIPAIATQLRPGDEFLILDDASTDDSLRVISPFVNEYPQIRLIRHEQNRGVVAAHARLFAEARGDYLYAGAADDIRLPGFFQHAMQMAEQFPQAGLIFGSMAMVDEAGRRLGVVSASRWREPLYAEPARFLDEYLLAEPPLHSPCAATIYRRDALMEVGAYRAELGSFSDTFAFRAIGLKYGACYVPDEVVQFRRVPGSFSQQSNAQPKRLLDLLARAEHLMRSAEFADRFPAAYVERWGRASRWQVIWNDFLGPESDAKRRPSFVVRNVRRLGRLLRPWPLLLYRGDVSCYEESETSSG